LPYFEEFGERIGYVDKYSDMVGDVRLESDYLCIYVDYGGSLMESGDTLLSLYDTYEKVLNLLCGGDCISICDLEIVQKCCGFGVSWDKAKPFQGNGSFLLLETHYRYLFKDGEWYYSINLSEWMSLRGYFEEMMAD
jgi:hypothetical protein